MPLFAVTNNKGLDSASGVLRSCPAANQVGLSTNRATHISCHVRNNFVVQLLPVQQLLRLLCARAGFQLVFNRPELILPNPNHIKGVHKVNHERVASTVHTKDLKHVDAPAIYALLLVRTDLARAHCPFKLSRREVILLFLVHRSNLNRLILNPAVFEIR